MNDERWGKLHEAFGEAVRLSPDDRRTFLEHAYGDDPALLAEVLTLLAKDEEANRSGFLEPLFPEKAEDLPNFDDRFRIIRKLGEGGMGVVYLAEHRVMERLVALKVIRHDLTTTPALIKRFHQEVKAAARLIDRNIVTAYDAGEIGNSHVLTMEYVEGTDLARQIKDHGPMPVQEACDVVHQAASGLQHAFEMEMVHRDIKPQNLMRTPKGQVKILDFGVARLASEVRSDAAPSAFLGTANFIAPEQINDPESADIRSDIYSLGSTLYALLAGHPPFPKNSVAETLTAHAEETPQTIDGIPAGLNLVLARMMAKRPADRYQTPNEVADALSPFLTGATPGDRALVRHEDGLEPTTPRLRQPGIRGIAVGAVLLGICILALCSVWLKTDERLARQRLIVAEVEKLGGEVVFDANTPDRPVIEVDLSNTVASDATLERLAGLTGIRSLNLMLTPVTDDGLRHLEGLTSLRVLNLHRTAVTDVGLEHLHKLPNLAVLLLHGPGIGDKGLMWVGQMDKLENLELSKTSITDAGLARLRRLSSLLRLSIEDTRIGDAGVEHLKELTQLRWLNLHETQVTNFGVSDLQKAIPSVVVTR